MKDKSKYPIEFQKLNEITLNNNNNNEVISILKYQNNKVIPIKLYKTISKMTTFDE